MFNKYLEKLEYNLIKEKLVSLCKTFDGREIAQNLEPMISKKEIQDKLDETNEMVTLINSFGTLPISYSEDFSPILKRIESSIPITAKALLNIAEVLSTSRELTLFFEEAEKEQESNFNIINTYFENLYINESIETRIKKAIISEDEISDTASFILNKIRKDKKNLEVEIRNKLNDLIHSNTYSKYIQDKVVTIRNGRYVIPVMNEYRSKFNGFIHDISSSGQTVYIEPTSIFDINNRINELEISETKEIERILNDLSSLLYPIYGYLNQDINLISLLDFVMSKARLSIELECTKPILDNYIYLKNARHPIIDRDKVVPINIYLGKVDEENSNFTTLVITGPNTGGKTVTLKTVGLLTLMAQSGLNIAATENSKIKVFDNIFADIGDDQSIAESLSTFSSHITNISHILDNFTKDSLILVDELGSGTDPKEGSSLAISLLEYFHNMGAFTLATTHYHEIKDYCYTHEGFMNCSLEFDLKLMKPTYRLLMGIPGKSNAFEISQKLGIYENILDRAKKLMDTSVMDSEKLFKEIYEDRITIEKEKEQIEKNLSQVKALRKKLEEQNDSRLKYEEEKIQKSREKSKQILIDAKEEADKILKLVNKLKVENIERKELENLRNNLNKKLDNFGANKLDFSGLSKLNDKYSSSDKKLAKKGHVSSNNNKAMTTSTEINIIGETVANGIEALDKYLDNCRMANLKTVRVVHGKGTGKLRQGVHDYLKTSKYVKSYHIASIGEGDYGVTIVELK